MLHHVPTLELQQHLILPRRFRVLRPGGVLIGSDSLASNDLHHFHADDTYNPIEPAVLLVRLQSLGFRPDHRRRSTERPAASSPTSPTRRIDECGS